MRRKAERDWKQNKTDENREKYIEQKKVCIDMAISKRTLYYSELVGGSEHCQKSMIFTQLKVEVAAAISPRL